jgi:hypothetical protein
VVKMQDLKGKILPLSIVVFLVMILLISNLGQDFKNDIFSYNNAISNSNSLIKYWDKSEDYQDYLNSSSQYLAEIFRKNGLKPLDNTSYIQEWSSNLPTFHGNSTLEVLSSYGRIVKKYEYGKDYFEDFRGIIKPGVVLGKTGYLLSMDSNLEKFPKVLLFSGYRNKQLQEIASIDSTLLTQGVSAVISPSSTNYLKYDSGLYESSFIDSKEGLSKLIVTPFIFEELKEFADKGFSIKIKSAGLIESTQLKNVYGILAGKNKAYKPLVIAAFYDGVYKTSDINSNEFEKYSITPSIITDCIRALNLQRSLKPDRTIIFTFLSGYNQNKEGQKKLFEMDIIADYMVFDGLGTGDKNMLVLNRGSKYFASTIEAKLKKNTLEVLSKSVNTDSSNNLVYITTINLDMKNNQFYPYINKSGRFLLSIIGDECYNLDFLSGNIREFRVFKRFVKEKTLLIASLTFLFLLVIIFRKSERKTN